MRTATLLLLTTLVYGSAHAALPAPAPDRISLPPVNIAAALKADELRAGPQPFRFAVPHEVRITPLTHGRWQSLADGREQWQLELHSSGAHSLNLGFTAYVMPEGGSLVLRSATGQERGPYTHHHNNDAGQLWTPVLLGDRVHVIVTLPAGARDALVLELARVNHGFRGFGAKTDNADKSGSCNIDVVCPDGDLWRDEIRSVARYTIGGLLLCTGQMMNNTAQDFAPLFLTANHCLTAPLQAPTTVFYWNYETSTCGGTPDGSLSQTTSGATFLAGSYGSTDVGPDFTLLELSETPPPDFNVFWSGWDNRDIAPLGVTAIHHPAGDEKRISMFFGQTEITAYLEQPGTANLAGEDDTHLRIRAWDRGTTEGGSSGSGIWNNERRLVGQLSGGFASCTSQTDDWYGRFHKNWFGLPTPLTSVATYLDPEGTGAEVLDGADPEGDVLNPPMPPSNPPPSTPSSNGRFGGGSFGLFGLLMLLGLRRRASVSG